MEQGEFIRELNRIIAENGGEVPEDKDYEAQRLFLLFLWGYLLSDGHVTIELIDKGENKK